MFFPASGHRGTPVLVMSVWLLLAAVDAAVVLAVVVGKLLLIVAAVAAVTFVIVVFVVMAFRRVTGAQTSRTPSPRSPCLGLRTAVAGPRGAMAPVCRCQKHTHVNDRSDTAPPPPPPFVTSGLGNVHFLCLCARFTYCLNPVVYRGSLSMLLLHPLHPPLCPGTPSAPNTNHGESGTGADDWGGDFDAFSPASV